MNLGSPQSDLLRQAGERLARLDPHGALDLIDQAERLGGRTHNSILNRAWRSG